MNSMNAIILLTLMTNVMKHFQKTKVDSPVNVEQFYIPFMESPSNKIWKGTDN